MLKKSRKIENFATCISVLATNTNIGKQCKYANRENWVTAPVPIVSKLKMLKNDVCLERQLADFTNFYFHRQHHQNPYGESFNKKFEKKLENYFA